MAKKLRALLIDPDQCRVDVHDIDPSTVATTSYELLRCTAMEHFRLADHGTSWDYGWVDEEGMVRGEPIAAFFFSKRSDPVAGRCLILGVDKNTGDTVDAKFPVDVLRDSIEWLGIIKPEVTWDHQGDVSRAIVTYSRVKERGKSRA